MGELSMLGPDYREAGFPWACVAPCVPGCASSPGMRSCGSSSLPDCSRKTLGFETPAERFEACAAMTD